MMVWTTLGYITERAAALFIIMAIVIWRGKKDLAAKDRASFLGTLGTTLAEVEGFWFVYKADGVYPDEYLLVIVHFPLVATTRRVYFYLVSRPDGPVFPGICGTGMGQTKSISLLSLVPSASHFPSFLVQNKPRIKKRVERE